MVFSRHKNQLLEEEFEKESSSNLFIFLPANVVVKKDINQFKGNRMLHPFDTSPDQQRE